MAKNYILKDIIQSYKWLGHHPHFTELNAFHPDYKPGKENFELNKKNKTFPFVWDVNSEKGVIYFVEKNSPERMNCISLNPRPKFLKNQNGYARSALENEIEIAQNMVFDFDFINKKTSKHQIADFELLLEKADQYFQDLGLYVPVRAFTGNGYHLLFAFPEIKVNEFPDLANKQKYFTKQFRQEFQPDLDNLESKLDSTQDLRRVVKIYGTSKPNVGKGSRFYGGERKEDEALKNYLINLKIPETGLEGKLLNLGHDLPQWFKSLLIRDSKLQSLWSGEGKPEGQDFSRSGYDYSVIKYLLGMGYKNIDELATILALRPNGGVKGSGKSEQYLRHTIANALLK